VYNSLSKKKLCAKIVFSKEIMHINYNWRKVTRIYYCRKNYTYKLFIENYIHKFVLGTDFMYYIAIVGDSRIKMLGKRPGSTCGWTWPERKRE
jgi:hypothetical protein